MTPAIPNPERWATRAREWRGSLLLLAVVAYLCAALYPFRWQIRGSHPNGLERTSKGELRLANPGIAHTTQGPDWLVEAIRSDALRVRTSARPANGTQRGPARIFTISENKGARNLMIGQDRNDLIVRLRHAGTSHNGIPAMVIPDVMQPGVWLDIDVLVTSRRATVKLDGRVAAEQSFATSPFETWDAGYGAAVGNEWSLWRTWLGSIRVLEITAGTRTLDLLRSPDLTIPAELSYTRAAVRSALTTREALSSEPHDLVQNVLGFIPLGFLLAALYPRARAWILLLAMAGLSIAMEGAQLFAEGRKSSPTDVATNLLGGALGIGAWMWMTARFARREA